MADEPTGTDATPPSPPPSAAGSPLSAGSPPSANTPATAGSPPPPVPPADKPPATDGEHGPHKGLSLHWKILIGLFIGAVFGLAANAMFHLPVTPGVVNPADVDQNGIDDRLDFAATNIADPLGKVLLRLVLMVVLPLVFTALSLGVLGIGDVGVLGRVGLKTLGFTLLLSATSVAVGLFLVNVMQPGKSLGEAERNALRAQYATGAEDAAKKAKQAKTVKDLLLDIIPENPLQEAVGAVDGSSKGNGMLSIMFVALVTGVALNFVPLGRRQPLVLVFEAIFETTMVIIGFAMKLAPYGVACLVFAITARLGSGILTTLFWFVLTVFMGLGFQLIVVYSLLLLCFTKKRPWDFFRQVSAAMLTAFGTSSSNATLPTAMRVAQEELKLPRGVSHFVLTIGSTGNQNGTALYEGMVVLFLAQVFGVELSLGNQVTVILMAILAGVGTAGVPGGSLPLIVILLQTVNVPPEGIGIILGVDRLLDMGRTVLNVTGDLCLATCVAQGEHDEPIIAQFEGETPEGEPL